MGHHASSHFFPLSLILTPTSPMILTAETCHPFLSGSPNPLWFSVWFFITLNGSFFFPAGWVGCWLPCIKGLFLPAAVTARRQRTAGKVLLRSRKPELEQVSYSTEMDRGVAGQGRAPRVHDPCEELVQMVTVGNVQTEGMRAGLHGGG